MTTVAEVLAYLNARLAEEEHRMKLAEQWRDTELRFWGGDSAEEPVRRVVQAHFLTRFLPPSDRAHLLRETIEAVQLGGVAL